DQGDDVGQVAGRDGRDDAGRDVAEHPGGRAVHRRQLRLSSTRDTTTDHGGGDHEAGERAVPRGGHVVARREPGDQRDRHDERQRDERAEDDARDVEAPHDPPGPNGLSPNGLGSPSFPGFKMPCGSSADFTARRTSNPPSSASGTKRDRLRPTPWWWLSEPPRSRTARVP